jgi:hypothetical protein
MMTFRIEIEQEQDGCWIAEVPELSAVLTYGWPDFVFPFHDAEELGPRMLARIGKRTGLRSDDL